MLIKAFLVLVGFLAQDAEGHGYLEEPPNRSILWRLLDDPSIAPYQKIVEPNYNDNQLYCGGFQHQQSLGGKCGICGDPWDGIRENEAGGKYGKGIIVRQYEPGSLMDVTVRITAHHLGYFEFRLCEWNNPTIPANLDCLNENLLQFEDGTTKYYLPNSGSTPWMYYMKIRLSSHIASCDQCILQWKYHAENSWNCDENNNCCMGCGPQEEFYGCADIAIGSGPTNPPPAWNESSPVTTTKSPSISTTDSAAPPPTTTTAYHVITTTTTALSTEAPSNNVVGDPSCEDKSGGKYKIDCHSYYSCGSGGQGPYFYDCPPGTLYDEYVENCNYESNIPPPCGSASPPASTTKSPTETTTTPKMPPNNPSCEGKTGGKYKIDCQSYYSCGSHGDGPYIYDCPPGTIYDEYKKNCNYDYNIAPPCGTKV